MPVKRQFIEFLKERGVLKSDFVEKAFLAVDRKDFVPKEYLSEAYKDYPILIGFGQTISQPYTVAFILDLLLPKPGEVIADIGAGSGWQSALLAHIVSQGELPGKVFAFELIPELCRLAEKNISKYGYIENKIVSLICGNAADHLPEGIIFDKIIAGAFASLDVPKAWRRHLKVGGVMVAPVGNSVWRYQRKSESAWKEEEFPGFVFVPLVYGR